MNSSPLKFDRILLYLSKKKQLFQDQEQEHTDL